MHLPTNFPTPSTRYKAAHDSGPRKASVIHNVVIHCTESETAESAASWFANPESEGSTQLVLGEYAGFRTLPDLVIPWGAPPLNTNGIHIEQVGYSEWSKKDWDAHDRTVQWCAFQSAIACVLYDIPVRWVNVAELKQHYPGITAHYVVSEAFGLTNHIDPGPNYPYQYFMECVEIYYKLHLDKISKLQSHA